jgi:hypothetical protein
VTRATIKSDQLIAHAHEVRAGLRRRESAGGAHQSPEETGEHGRAGATMSPYKALSEQR